jgi:hypothetical protein
MKTLLFIDTNILLDFYRTRTEAGLSLLRHVDSIRNCILTTYQVEMEFKKHRQGAILESHAALKLPQQISRPGIFSEAKAARALQKDMKSAEKRLITLRRRLKDVFTKPTTHDPVYKVVQRIFTNNGALNLTRDSDHKSVIRRRAFRRFILGCPPRKQGDTSMGDAINWEWIIHCAATSRAEIVIVSRDSDYGVTFEEKSFLNDFLLQEFKDRVSQQRKIALFTRLSEALKLFKVAVTPEEQREEEALIKAPMQSTVTHNYDKIMQQVIDDIIRSVSRKEREQDSES